eukprot:2427475-Amphidinium_carterae.1
MGCCQWAGFPETYQAKVGKTSDGWRLVHVSSNIVSAATVFFFQSCTRCASHLSAAWSGDSLSPSTGAVRSQLNSQGGEG